MDGLDWVGAEIGVNNSTSWESDPRGESLMGSNSSNYAFLGGKVDIPESIFSPNQLHITGSSTFDSNCSRVSHMFQHSAPYLDPIQITSSWNFSQQEEAIKLSDDDDKVPGKSLGSDLSSSPMLNGTDFINQLNGLFSDYGMANKLLINNCLQEAKAGLIATATGSSGSLDCLLSASTSNTDNTSVEDDAEISKIFSDCKNLWNFRAVDAVSSGYSSACDSSNAKDQRHNHNNINELHETASQNTSSDQHANQAKPSGKRKSEALLKNVVNNYTSDSSTSFNMISETPPQPKKPRSEKHPSSSNINFQQPSSSLISRSGGEPDSEAIAQVKEMMYQAAAFRPVSFGTEMMEKPKRKNVRISTDPQTVAARQRRERISERIRVLQRMVPGGSKMDTASMLDEAANYLKFLRSQVKALEAYGQKGDELVNYHPSVPFNHSFPLTPNFPFHNPNFIYHPKF